jgi:hypothetical protein
MYGFYQKKINIHLSIDLQSQEYPWKTLLHHFWSLDRISVKFRIKYTARTTYSAMSRKLYSYVKTHTKDRQPENKGLAEATSRLFWCDNLECRNEARPTALVPEAFEKSI